MDRLSVAVCIILGSFVMVFALDTDVTTVESQPYVTGGPSESNNAESIDTSECCKTKGCMRLPRLCQSDECQHILTWKENSQTKTVDFELGAIITDHPPWIAVGFAPKQGMVGASVVDCIVDPWLNITIQASYNPAHYNEVLQKNTLGLLPDKSSASYSNGTLICKFTKVLEVDSRVNESDKVANLTKSHYILLAYGKTDENGVKRKHTDEPTISPVEVLVSDNIDVKVGRLGHDMMFVGSHATLMILAWMLLSSIGIVSARHYKSVWSNKICRQKLWFQIHRGLMVLTVLLSITALVLIFVARKTTPLKEQMLHPILGMIVASLMVLNLTLGLFRPHPDSSSRPIFNWVHCLVGNGAHLVAVVAMYFGVRCLGEEADLASWAPWVVVAFGAWKICTEIAMTTQKYFSKEDLQVAYVEMSGSSESTTVVLDRKVTTFKMVMLILYLTGTVICTITLLYGILPPFVAKP